MNGTGDNSIKQLIVYFNDSKTVITIGLYYHSYLLVRYVSKANTRAAKIAKEPAATV